ncbi:Y-family DNA polymerase [Deinococcus aluminii]|uniref:DNA polymerase IV n=1 Tax=Deinococcus aluminii TaxID=1656885 RepID=A0ABP9XF49_9DEIO
MAPGRTPAIACVLLHPWPLVLLARTSPGLPVAVLNQTRRVVAATQEALALGVQPGMREAAALSRCPELHADVVTAPTATAAWQELLETLYARYSDRVEGREPGVAFLKVGAAAARDLAAALHAPVGLAASLDVAQLAALRAKPGEVREVNGGEGEKAFLALCPAAHLHVVGLTPAHVERLHFLGVRGLADLMKWSAAQREAFLGVDIGKRLNRFLRGERTTNVTRYVPGKVLEASLNVDTPLQQPTQADAALADLLPGLVSELRGRTCAYLTVHADTVGGRLSATRKLKWPLDERGLTRVAGLALAETDALALGVDALTVQLSGLQQPSRMVGLWAGLAELEVTKAVLDRFPEALVRVEWLDPFAYTADAQYQWVDWLTGTVRPTPMTPRQTWTPPTPTRKHEQAVSRVLAFFEGRDP